MTTRLGAWGILLSGALALLAGEGRANPAAKRETAKQKVPNNKAGSARAGVAAIRTLTPNQVSVKLPNGESLHLYGNLAVAIYRDGPRPPVDPTSPVPSFAQRRLGESRSSSFFVSEATRVRITALVLSETDHSPPRRLPHIVGPGPLRVSAFYSSKQTGTESRLVTATRVLPEQDTTSSRVLRDLVQRVLEAHRHDDGL